MNNFHTPNWQTHLDDKQLDSLAHLGFMVIDDCFTKAMLRALQDESGFLSYKAATLTHGERISHIRGDGIRWIDDNCPVGMAYLSAMDKLGRFFNQTFYTAICESEAHYACYPVGFGYEWHKDNPIGRHERVLSAVYYLNEHWTPHDGGAIMLIDKTDSTHSLLPCANRLVVFDSNLLHKVAISHRTRYSIATWLRTKSAF